MTPEQAHELECARAAIAARIEKEKNRAEIKAWREFLKEIETRCLATE